MLRIFRYLSQKNWVRSDKKKMCFKKIDAHCRQQCQRRTYGLNQIESPCNGIIKMYSKFNKNLTVNKKYVFWDCPPPLKILRGPGPIKYLAVTWDKDIQFPPPPPKKTQSIFLGPSDLEKNSAPIGEKNIFHIGPQSEVSGTYWCQKSPFLAVFFFRFLAVLEI